MSAHRLSATTLAVRGRRKRGNEKREGAFGLTWRFGEGKIFAMKSVIPPSREGGERDYLKRMERSRARTCLVRHLRNKIHAGFREFTEGIERHVAGYLKLRTAVRQFTASRIWSVSKLSSMMMC